MRIPIEQKLERIAAGLRAYDAEKAILFGSAARDDAEAREILAFVETML